MEHYGNGSALPNTIDPARARSLRAGMLHHLTADERSAMEELIAEDGPLHVLQWFNLNLEQIRYVLTL